MVDRRAAKAFGWPQRPEDDPDIDPGTRRLRIRKRKGQRLGSILATGGVKRLARKAESPIYSGTEADAVKHMLQHRLNKGAKRVASRIKKLPPN